ncbi:MAG: alpha-ribazole phosphatase [Clostridiales bacterium]|nr:alpha-ribazole phosphatase [Clostridiales bacterium]
MKIQVIRHGKTLANVEKRFCGKTDLSLCKEGIEELMEQRDRINYPKADYFVTSSKKRTRQTLYQLYQKEPDFVLSEWDEIDFGDFEMYTYKELKNQPVYIEWQKHYQTAPFPNGEGREAFLKRIQWGYQKLCCYYEKTDASILVVTHGGVIAEWMQLQFPGEKNYYEWQPDFGRGYVVDWENNQIRYQEL